MRHPLFLLATTGTVAALGGCSRDMFSGDAAKEAAAAIASKIGGRVMAMLVEITRQKLVIRAQDPGNPTKVLHWWFHDGNVGRPKPVTLVGDGTLQDSLFALADVDFGKVPAIAKAASERSGKPVREMRIMFPVVRRLDVPLGWTVDFRGAATPTPTSMAGSSRS
jgi:hypothetical protein